MQRPNLNGIKLLNLCHPAHTRQGFLQKRRRLLYYYSSSGVNIAEVPYNYAFVFINFSAPSPFSTLEFI